MEYFVNSVSSPESITRDIKELIPDPQTRRRMSVTVRSGVATAMECLAGMPEGEEVSAIIVATGLGCLSDSEKFLRTVIGNDEQLLTPTPFIQSTFNTIGAQVALLTGNRGYNMTYSNGADSFGNALLDAIMSIDEGASHVLLGAADEATPTLEKIAGRMGLLNNGGLGEGYHFFILSSKPLDGCVAVIKDIRFGEGDRTDLLAGWRNGKNRNEDKEVFNLTSDAGLLYDSIIRCSREKNEVNVVLPGGRTATYIRIGCL